MNLTKVDFLLNDKVVFLNHGSFGACPKVVFEEYQYWQRELELQPVEFIGRKLPELLKWSREKLSNYICCNPEEVVYITNATEGVNIIARSLKFKKGDEILCTNHEYGACDRT
ncbi:MAG: aminotransferase class V-fold PLP-dependent enzyme, partial [Candidatus Kapaibacterium sp.]